MKLVKKLIGWLLLGSTICGCDLKVYFITVGLNKIHHCHIKLILFIYLSIKLILSSTESNLPEVRKIIIGT